MKSAQLAEVEADLQKYLEDCAGSGPLVITKRGKTVGVLLAPPTADDLERLELARSPRFWKMIEDSRKRAREGKTLSWDEFWQAVEERAATREKKVVTGAKPAKRQVAQPRNVK